MNIPDVRITTIKISVKCCVESFDLKQRIVECCVESDIEYTQYVNFIVIRFGYTYTIYYGSGKIGISGLLSESEDVIDQSMMTLCVLLKLKLNLFHFVSVDNFCATGAFNREINLMQLHKVAKQNKVPIPLLSYVYRNAKFPAFVTRTSRNTYVSLFKSGKFVVLGAKSRDDIRQAIEDAVNFVNMFLFH